MEILKQQDLLVCLEKRNNRLILSKNEVDITESINDFTKYLNLVIDSLRLIETRYEKARDLMTEDNLDRKQEERIDEQNQICYQKSKLFELLQSYYDLQLQITSNEDEYQIKFTNPYYLDYEELNEFDFNQTHLEIKVKGYCRNSSKDQKFKSKQLDYIRNTLKKERIKFNVNNMTISINYILLCKDSSGYSPSEHQSEHGSESKNCSESESESENDNRNYGECNHDETLTDSVIIDLCDIQTNNFYISVTNNTNDYEEHKIHMNFKVNISSICRVLIMGRDSHVKFKFNSNTYKTFNICDQNLYICEVDDECYLLSSDKRFLKLEEEEISIHELTLLRLAAVIKQNIQDVILNNIQKLFVDLILD